VRSLRACVFGEEGSMTVRSVEKAGDHASSRGRKDGAKMITGTGARCKTRDASNPFGVVGLRAAGADSEDRSAGGRLAGSLVRWFVGRMVGWCRWDGVSGWCQWMVGCLIPNTYRLWWP